MKSCLKTIFLFFTLITNAFAGEEKTCSEECNTRFGLTLGTSFSTKAYSNCNSDCVKNEDNYIQLDNRSKIFTGMKWQCVEYARRWLIQNHHRTFPNVTYAYQIWDLPHAKNIDTQEPIPFLKYKNKESDSLPIIGDLLIYSNAIGITGHVAVVVGIDRDSIIIAEQNYFNRRWDAKNYSRRLLWDKSSDGRFRIIDEALIGWVRISA